MKGESSCKPLQPVKAKILPGFGHLVARTAMEKEQFALNFVLENEIHGNLSLIPFCGFGLLGLQLSVKLPGSVRD